jgi:hypothetical protein
MVIVNGRWIGGGVVMGDSGGAAAVAVSEGDGGDGWGTYRGCCQLGDYLILVSLAYLLHKTTSLF